MVRVRARARVGFGLGLGLEQFLSVDLGLGLGSGSLTCCSQRPSEARPRGRKEGATIGAVIHEWDHD